MPATICSACIRQHDLKIQDEPWFSEQPGTTMYCALCEAKQDLVEAQCDGERLRGLLGEAFNDRHVAAEMSTSLFARIDAELKGDGDA